MQGVTVALARGVSRIPLSKFKHIDPHHWHSVGNGSLLHCEWYLWLSFTEPAKPYAPQHISGSVCEIYHSKIYHTKSGGLRKISHSEIYHRKIDLAPPPPPPHPRVFGLSMRSRST